MKYTHIFEAVFEALAYISLLQGALFVLRKVAPPGDPVASALLSSHVLSLPKLFLTWK
jgi:hypothetical protein